MAEFGFSRRRQRPPRDLVIDYKNVELLRSFLTPGGKIAPARLSRLNTKQQRQLARAVKRARNLALIPWGFF